MAQFNPSPGQVQDQAYWHWSKPISTPESDKSGAYALKGAGDVIGDAVKGADTTIKAELDSEIHEKVDTERQQYTDALVLAENSLNSRGTTLGGDQGQQTGEVPADVKGLSSAASALQGARANGRISETYYFSRLDSLAKDFRGRFPGYRDYIDQKISEVTGVTPANAYIKSLIGDINAAKGSGQKDSERVLGELQKFVTEGVPDAPAQVQRFMQTGDLNAANIYMNNQNSRKYAIQQHENERKDATATAGDRSDSASGQADLILNGLFVDHWNKNAGQYGINSPKDMDDLLKRAAAGQLTIPPSQIEGLGMQLHASSVQMQQDAMRSFTKIDPHTGRSLMTDLGGPAKAKEKLDAFMSNWNTTADLITSDKLGLANVGKRISDETVSAAKSNLLTDKERGAVFANLAAINQISPKFAEDYFKDIMIKPEFEKNLKTYMAAQSADLMAQPDYVKTGIVKTFKQKFEDLQTKQIDSPKTYEQYVKLMESIADPKNQDIKLKKNIALAAFDPSNVGMINQTFKQDTVINGKQMPGRFSVYNRLGTDDYVKSMKSLNDPKSWDNYVSFMGKSFGDLMGPEIQGLNKIQGSQYVQLTWDDKNHRWGLHQNGDPTGKDILYEQQTVPRLEHVRAMGDAASTQLQEYKQSINRLNGAIRPLTRVIEAEGGNLDQALLQHMFNAGLDPTKGRVPLSGVPKQMMDAIIQTREAAQPSKKWFDKGTDMPSPAPLQ